jgi:hypothetical protein
MNMPLDIGTRRELFLDDYLIDDLSDAALRLHHPERRETAITFDAPWEDNVAGVSSVVQADDGVLMHYRASIPDLGDEDYVGAAMARSSDHGLSFAHPALGVVEFDGSKENNLIHYGGPPCPPPVFLDTNPDCRPDQRYKGLAAQWQKLFPMCSEDAVTWHPMMNGSIEMSGTFDTINTVFWDSVTGCYRCFTRYFENMPSGTSTSDLLGSEPNIIRAIQSSTSDDFIHWTEPIHHRYADGIETMQLYTNATVPCPGAEHIYLSFPMRYQEGRIAVSTHPNPGASDSVFMASRDGIEWTRYGEAWVRPGLDMGNWTERSNIPVWGIVETSPTEWSMYISEHYRQSDAPCRLRRLSIRPHGFASLHAGYYGGEVVTKPLILGDSTTRQTAPQTLRINYSTSAVGSVRVEILDEAGAPLQGHSLDDADVIFGDELDRSVTWNGSSDISAMLGKPVRLRFVLNDADVWAMRVTR